ncbi:hypothetical protein PGT21_021483 [Puccinia graminis f. sp. tritici]|uniref:Uncharacterized protein n=1 Tax=Puccinia graminis f. sp. tritici TaxID=56615 RepID=A0A5B0LZ28_PUCGR|nr:hypothetical protein PGT21_021483 [Puccinia graminis f. sp. tritici]
MSNPNSSRYPLPQTLPQISGWVKIHSVSPQLRAHDPTQPNLPDFVLSVDDSVLNRMNPQLQITSRIWLTGTVTRYQNHLIYLTVQHLSYSSPPL